jgi:hypothetical protein
MAYAVKSITWLMQGRWLTANITTLSILPMDAVKLVIVPVLFGVLILWRIYLKKFRLTYDSVWPCYAMFD